MQRDAVAQSNPSAEYSASFDVFVCQIDPSNSTLIPGGRKSRGAAKATSNVENVIFCRKTKLIEKIYSGLTATDVELINRGKHLYLTSGDSDLVIFVDAPSGDNVAKFALAVSSQGNVRTRTVRAWSADEYRKLISELP